MEKDRTAVTFLEREPVKFTVIVPTRERPDTLIYCLRTLVSQDYKNLTILVSDNFSQDNTLDVVLSFDDPRILYINTGKRLSMAQNWEYALNHVKDGWVSFLGDDDGLLPGALGKASEIIANTGCDAIVSDVCRYDWPNSGVRDNGLIVPLRNGNERRDARLWLSKVMSGKAGYMDLPYVYTGGFVKLSAISKARRSDGIFFCSIIPDVYSGVAIASVLDWYVYSKEPLAIAGLSCHSTGASELGISKSTLPADRFFAENTISFHTVLAGAERIKSGRILLFECYLQAKHLHHDFLHLEIKDQLALALSAPDIAVGNGVREYCELIATRNQIDMKSVDNQVRSCVKATLRNKIQDNIFRSFSYLVLPGQAFGVYDVYAASLLARSAFLFQTVYLGWQIKKVWLGVRKFLRCF